MNAAAELKLTGGKKLIIILPLFTIIGCSYLNARLDTPEKKYIAARAELNLLLEEYIQIQDKIPDDSHKKAREAFYTADLALDTWQALMNNKGYDYRPDLQTWLNAKHIILEVIKNGR